MEQCMEHNHCCSVRHDSDAYTDTDTDSDSDAYTDTDADSHTDAYTYTHSYPDSHADSYPHTDSYRSSSWWLFRAMGRVWP
jgi:hypothetical protein